MTLMQLLEAAEWKPRIDSLGGRDRALAAAILAAYWQVPNDAARERDALLDVLERFIELAGVPRPIASAPRDGTQVLAWEPSYYQREGGWCVALWRQGSWWDGQAWKVEPTLWLPLPPAPAKQDFPMSRAPGPAPLAAPPESAGGDNSGGA